MTHLPLRHPCLIAVLLLALPVVAPLAGCGGRSPDRAPAADTDPMGDPRITADTHFAAGQLAEAQSASRSQSGSPAAAKQAADALRQTALAHYVQALALDPAHAQTLYRLAVIHTEQKQWDKAIAHWQRYVESQDRSPDSLVNLGLALELASRPADADKAYRAAVAADPRHKGARVNLGLLLARLGRVSEGQGQLAAVLDEPAVHYHLSVAARARGDAEAAARHLRTAAALDPRYAAPTPVSESALLE